MKPSGRKKGSKDISPRIELLIKQYALRDKKMPREAVAAELQNTIGSMGAIVPTEETLLKKISDARSQDSNPLDEYWSIGSIAKYNIPTDALWDVIGIYAKSLVKESDQLAASPDIWEANYNNNLQSLGEYLSIRVALWISRLHTIIKDKDNLHAFATAYALEEQIDEIMGRTPCSIELDLALFHYLIKEEQGDQTLPVSVNFMNETMRSFLEQRLTSKPRRRKKIKRQRGGKK